MSGGGTVRSLFSVNDSNRWKIRKISEQYVASVQTLLTYKNKLLNKLRNSGKISGGGTVRSLSFQWMIQINGKLEK